jgi:alpha-ketoglutarate-dependent taurine dioxygenase
MDDLETRIKRLSPERQDLLQQLLDAEGIRAPFGTKFAGPSNETEATLCSIWSQVLGVETGIHGNYFELGGDSILSVIVVSKARAAGLPLTTDLLFQLPTIAELAAKLTVDVESQARGGTLDKPAPTQQSIETPQTHPLTPLQQGLLFHALRSPKSGTYISQFFCTLSGPLDLMRFQAAWTTLVNRHAVLRAGIVFDDNGRPGQLVQPHAEFTVAFLDWTQMKAEEQKSAVDAFLETDLQTEFDLASPPFMRVTVMRTALDTHYCVWTHHHIMLDGWSELLLLRELFEIYANPETAEITVGQRAEFTDYVRWLEVQDHRAAESFWKQYLNGSHATRLPGKSAAQIADASVEKTLVSEEDTKKLESVARQRQLTMHTLLKAAWALVLAHLANSNDVTFGVTASVRPPELQGSESLVGLCINTLPVRIVCAEDQALPSWLHDLQIQQREWQRYLYTPLTELQRWLDAAPDAPLFENLFVFENFPKIFDPSTLEAPLIIDDLRFVMREQYPLVIVIVPSTQLLVQIKYDRQRYDDELISSLSNLYKKAIDIFTDMPDLPVRTIRTILEESWREDEERRRSDRRQTDIRKLRLMRQRRSSTSVTLRGEQLVSIQRAADQSLPVIISPATESLVLEEWVRDNRPLLETLRLRHGAFLLRGFRSSGVNAFRRVLAALSDRPMEYLARSTPRQEMGGNVYTSTEYPSDQVIPFHNENAYAHTWPLLLAFYCEIPAMTGGRTLLSDCRQVLRKIDPVILNRFREKNVMYLRNYSEGLGLPWQTVFGTSNRAEVEAFCRQAGYDFEWRTEGRLRTRHVAPAVLQHPVTKEPIWFNHAAFFHVSRLEPQTQAGLLQQYAEDDLPNNTYYGDGSSIEPSVIANIASAYEESASVFQWMADDILVIDNMLTAHGRENFDGHRRTLVGMAEPVSRLNTET